MRSLWPFALVFGISACELTASDDPITAYLAFHRAAQGRNPSAAFAGLSTPTRQLLLERAKEISAASGGAIKDDPIPLVLAPTLRPFEPAKPQVSKLSGDTAWLTVEVGGQSSEVKLILEHRKWKVDLTHWLADAS